MIAAHGTQTALDVLLEIHTGATISLKGAVMDSLETLAGRRSGDRGTDLVSSLASLTACSTISHPTGLASPGLGPPSANRATSIRCSAAPP